MTQIPSGIGAGDVLLCFLPAHMLPDEAWAKKIESRFPGLAVRYLAQEDPATGSVRDINTIPPDLWPGVTVLASMYPPDADTIPHIRFVQVPSSGADRWIKHDIYKKPGVVVCTSNGTHAPQIAEWVIGTWIMARHHFLAYAGYMTDGSGWAHRTDQRGDDSMGTRVGILGYGAIGRQVARIATSLGMEVYAYTRSEKATAAARFDDSYCVEGTGDAEGTLPAKWFHGASRAAVNDFLAQDLDLLVVATPLTSATTGLLDAEQFACLSQARKDRGKAGTYVVNIARGKVINTDALLVALRTEQIAGAALDVTDPEPLPENHELWRAPNVFIAPHVSWHSSHMRQRVLSVLETNLARLHVGEPLVNVINKELNY